MKYIKATIGKLFSRMFIVLLMIVLQFAAIMLAVQRFSEYFQWFYLFCMTVSVVVVLLVINREIDPGYKLAMIIPIMLFPLFGGVIYLTLYSDLFNRRVLRRMGRIDLHEKKLYAKTENGIQAADMLPDAVSTQFRCLNRLGGCPLYHQTETTYYPLGDAMYQIMKDELQLAERFIYLEYFIIAPGKMWDGILDILQQKARAGVDVRIIYDDIGTIRHLPWRYDKRLREMGIRCQVYNPLVPLTAVWQNKRDHRKILAIDGRVAFTGGINLSDEYINIHSRVGHWKDVGIMLRGDGALTLTLMFRSLWGLLAQDGTEAELTAEAVRALRIPAKEDGYVMPYGDNPYDSVQLGRDVYLGAIQHAVRSICITTPYFIVDAATLTALKLARAGGVRVRIITPHRADKWYVHLITRSYYCELLACGIEVYEYTPGFIHAKNLIADGEVGICGSVNFDYRSFYLQLECGVLMYRTAAVSEMAEDFEETLTVCEQITPKKMRHQNFIMRLVGSVLRLFAPLM